MSAGTFTPRAEVIHGDCLSVMRGMEADSVDAAVTDPPYGLEFMGKDWDTFDPRVGRGARVASERADELTPTGRGHDSSKGPYLASRIESIRIAGAPFQAWCQSWATEALRVLKPGGHLLAFGGTRTYHRMACAVEDAGFEVRDCLMWLQGQGFPKSKNIGGGWGTALKPAVEPIILARKPLSERNVAANVQRWGTGAINVEGCRIKGVPATGGTGGLWSHYRDSAQPHAPSTLPAGRWPANVALDEGAAAALDNSAGLRSSGSVPLGTRRTPITNSRTHGDMGGSDLIGYGDCGGASRFFYVAKADKGDRGLGNDHPTVKPVDLMRWLCRLVTPPGGTVLDHFCGSGTTLVAAAMEGFHSIGIEQDEHYCDIARRRVKAAAQPRLDLAGDAR